MLPLPVLVRLGARSLRLHKLRSSLSILGVVFGVAAVVAMSSVGEGARREALDQLGALGMDSVTLRSRRSSAQSTTRRRRSTCAGVRASTSSSDRRSRSWA